MTFFVLRFADNVAVPARAKQNNNCEKAGFPLTGLLPNVGMTIID
jgi:hypothetical protein